MKLGIDTNAFIYMFEKDPNFFAKTYPVFRAVEKGKILGVCSILVLTEILAYPFKAENFDLAQQYLMILSTFPNLRIIEVDQKIAVMAAKLRAAYNITPMDAIMVATAICTGCDAFLTNDDKIKGISELKIYHIRDDDLAELVK
jgi:predicted nucleic acid-binding protein